jgi:hypothetical protein
VLNHNAICFLTVDGRTFGPFREAEAAGKEGAGELVRSGGMAPPRAHAGTYDFTEVTWQLKLDHDNPAHSGLVQWFMERVGDRFEGRKQPLDSKGRAGFFRPIVSQGIINGAAEFDFDAEGNDAATLSVTLLPDKIV